MSTAQITQEVQVSGSIISFNIFEQKLMRNFYIINTRLKKLDEINDLDLKIKGLEKELKFLSMKTETIAEKIPQEGSTLTKTDVKMISKEQIYEVLNSRDQKLMNTRFHDEIKKEIESLRVELAKVRIGSSNQKKQLSSGLGQKQASFTAGQVLLHESNKKILPKDSLQECLDPNQYNLVNDMVQGSQQPTGGIMDEINKRFEEMNLKIEEIKLAKIVKENGEKELERFERYEQYEDKSQQAVRKKKEKPIRLDGIKRENVRGEILKNQMFSEYQKAQLLKAEIARQPIEKKSLMSKPANTFTNFNFKEDKRDLKVQERGEQKEKEKQKEREKSKRSRSLKRLERIQKRLKVDDSKDLNGVLREIQLRIQARVPHQVFMGFVHDIQEKLEILRITKDTSYDISELRKMIYSIQTRLQAIISFLQNSTNEDDARFVKKPWTCASCDKNLQKYSGKLGQHLNWQSVNAKKLSPMKAGAFGQTGQLANKIRTIMQSQRGGE